MIEVKRDGAGNYTDESNKSRFASVSVDGHGDRNVIVINVRD